MINWLQKSLYRLGLLSPILIVNFLIGFFFRDDSSVIMWACLIMGIILLAYHIYFILLAVKKLPLIQFKIDTTPEENDIHAFEIFISYVLPLLELIDGIQILNVNIVCITLFLACFLIITFINNTLPSPMYLLLGYHYHVVKSKDKKYMLLSRRKNYRNVNKELSVRRIFEDLLIIAE